MKFLIFTKGPGETSQGYALAKQFSLRGHQIFIGLQQETNASFFAATKQAAHLSFTPDPLSLTKLVRKIKPDGVILCNSKTFNKTTFIKKSPWPDTPTFTLDSNWLFNSKVPIFRFVRWADKYFLNFPPQVFKLGLKENGGYFAIDPAVLERIETVGLIPSYKKPSSQAIIKIRKKWGFRQDEKVIFCYFSGFGAGQHAWVFFNLFKAVKKIINRGNKIRIVYTGSPIDHSLDQPYLQYLPKNSINIESFFTTLASTDLVFQHQGLGTLEQAISAQIPIIANVNKENRPYYPRLHEEEVKPFARLNLCRLLFKSTNTKVIEDTIHDLLYNQNEIRKMKAVQAEYYSNGEESLLKSVEKFYAK